MTSCFWRLAVPCMRDTCTAEHMPNAQMLDRQVEEVPDQEWMESVRASYQPAQITDALWIVPRCLHTLRVMAPVSLHHSSR